MKLRPITQKHITPWEKAKPIVTYIGYGIFLFLVYLVYLLIRWLFF